MPFDTNRTEFARNGRLRAAVRELRGQHTTVLDQQLKGLGCSCQVTPVRGGMKGYRRAILSGRVNIRGRGLGAAPAAGVPALIPVSDRTAVANAIKKFQGAAHGISGR